MPSFQNPAAFLLLILIPVLFLLRKLGFFSKISFVITLSDWGGESFSWKGKIRRFASFLVFLLTILGYVSAVTALAGPIMYKQERVYTSLQGFRKCNALLRPQFQVHTDLSFCRIHVLFQAYHP